MDIRSLAIPPLLALPFAYGQPGEFQRSPTQLEFLRGGNSVFIYNLSPPPNSGLPLEAGGYFHPLKTPGGIVVTDFVPDDHKHHRGLFFAWVEMHGEKDSDFWGWGEYAPVKDRRIVNRSIETGSNSFTSFNDWMAGDTLVIAEKLQATSTFADGLNILDLVYQLTPKADVTLARWSFSGFCLRVRKDGDIRIFSPDGESALENPNHLKPETDWPDAAWYGCEQKLPDGKIIGAAVFNPPSNPPTLWHNQRGVRMLNPCIVAQSEVKLAAGKPLVLRYRVATFDGPLPTGKLNALAGEWK